MKILRIIIIVVFGLFSQAYRVYAAEWQWSVQVISLTSSETNDHPRAFLWIPPNCRQVRGVVIGQHNMLEEGILEHYAFRKSLSEIGFAEIWITPSVNMVFDSNTVKQFDEMLKSLADVSGYQELEFAPVIPIGHSAAASYPWNFAAFDPGRTLAILSIHGDAPLTNRTGSGKPNPAWGTRNIDGIPGLMVMGEYEWGDFRLLPAIQFKKDYPKSPIGLLADAGHGHFDFSNELVDFLSMFIRKAAKARLPKVMPQNAASNLRLIDPARGWLVDRWRMNNALQAASASYYEYKGNKEEAFWAFDKEMAIATENYYNRARAKTPQYIGYIQKGRGLPGGGSFIGYKLSFSPKKDGLTFNISAAFVDSAQGKTLTEDHAKGKINITRICGPVQKIDDTTFRIQFYRMGLNNLKRTGDIWLMASNPGDEKHKSAVQQVNLKIPLRNDVGADQKIDFPTIPEQNDGVKSVEMFATSSAGVPVSYYVREGPAEVEGSRLVFTKVPPKTKFPLRVTVVAWQYGSAIEPRLKTAEPVERNFFIVK